MAESQEFQVGDVVQFKSGGPFMTVTKVFTNAEGVKLARCFWFDAAGQVADTNFQPVFLRLIAGTAGMT